MKTIALIAFDLDGTLADTEALSIPSAVALMRDHYGVPITEDYWLKHLKGLAGQSLMDAIETAFGIKIDLQDLIARRSAQLPQIYAGGVQPAPGMLQAVRNLAAQGHQLCICSNSLPERIHLTLTHITGQHSAGLNLPHLFEGHIFSATGPTGTGKSKPAPDVYLAAARHYGANPRQCIAVEDTVFGIQAAVTAGFTCYAYTGLIEGDTDPAPKLLAAGAIATFPHWDDFLNLLQNRKR